MTDIQNRHGGTISTPGGSQRLPGSPVCDKCGKRMMRDELMSQRADANLFRCMTRGCNRIACRDDNGKPFKPEIATR